MIDMMYNFRVGDIHSAEFSDEFNKLCIPFENSLSEEQIDVFHKILDCVSDTAAADMRAVYKVGFKDGVALMKEIQDYYYYRIGKGIYLTHDVTAGDMFLFYHNIQYTPSLPLTI